MPKNIVICCDGTGNEVSASEYTNVVKLYRRLRKHDASQQLNYYDPGLGTLGTPGFRTWTFTKLSRLRGLATGYGLEDNVKDAYLFLMRNYEENDRVFLFGFSRGAYTVRALSGMLFRIGLLEAGNDQLAEHAIKRFFERARGTPDWRGMARFKKIFSRPCPVHFVGVWDTVNSVGLLRPKKLAQTADMKGVSHGRHAVALNEMRSKFRTNLWEPENGQNFAQVWFPGVHADVGGSYRESGLSDAALEWMLVEAAKFGLLIETTSDDELKPNPLGKMHNSLLPVWWLLGWWARDIDPLRTGRPVWIHESVRIRRENDARFDQKCERQIRAPFEYVKTAREAPRPNPTSNSQAGVETEIIGL